MSETYPSDADQVFRLIYRSRSLIPEHEYESELGEIFSEAKSNNKKQDITGALVCSGGRFAQVLEGDSAAVQELYARIANDSRHDSVTVVQTQSDVDRVFSRWSMARVSDDSQSEIPLIVNHSRVVEAAGRPTTPAQDVVLDDMREMVFSHA